MRKEWSRAVLTEGLRGAVEARLISRSSYEGLRLPAEGHRQMRALHVVRSTPIR